MYQISPSFLFSFRSLDPISSNLSGSFDSSFEEFKTHLDTQQNLSCLKSDLFVILFLTTLQLKGVRFTPIVSKVHRAIWYHMKHYLILRIIIIQVVMNFQY